MVEAPAPAIPVTPPSQAAPAARSEPQPARRTRASKPRTVETPARRETGTSEELAAPKAQTEDPPAETPERPASGSSTATQRLG